MQQFSNNNTTFQIHLELFKTFPGAWCFQNFEYIETDRLWQRSAFTYGHYVARLNITKLLALKH